MVGTKGPEGRKTSDNNVQFKQTMALGGMQRQHAPPFVKEWGVCATPFCIEAVKGQINPIPHGGGPPRPPP